MNSNLSAVFEPGVPPPEERLATLAHFKSLDMACGMFLLPVIPHLTDSPEMIYESVSRAVEAGLDFVIFGGMTLKEGRQKDHFLNVLKHHSPALLKEYQRLYRGSPWGEAEPSYYHAVNTTFSSSAKKYHIPVRIPPYLFRDHLTQNDLVVVILEQMDYLLKLEGRSSSLGYAAYCLSQLKEPLSDHIDSLGEIKGVGRAAEGIVREILTTGKCAYHEKLLIPA
jgi:hypothetical protein